MLEEKVIIVFGMGPAGLFLARQLKKEKKIVYGIGKQDDIGRYSNTLKKYFVTESVIGVQEAIKKISNEEKQHIGGYICSDQYLTMFLEEYPSIFDVINISEPGIEAFKLIYDKEGLVKYCRERKMNFPMTYSSENILKGSVDYPIAVKPNIKRGRSPLKKVYVIRSEIELTEFLSNVKSAGYEVDNFLFQQYINGNNGWEYGYGGYFKEGNPITEVFFVQARQYPQGVSCYTMEITDSELRNQIRDAISTFLSDMKYTGFLQFDLKQDEKTKKIYVLDINPRPWGSISILSPRCSDQSVFNKKKDSELSYCWHFPLKELASFRNKNNVKYKDCKKNAQRRKVVDLFDKDDLKPFFAQLVIAIEKIKIKLSK